MSEPAPSPSTSRSPGRLCLACTGRLDALLVAASLALGACHGPPKAAEQSAAPSGQAASAPAENAAAGKAPADGCAGLTREQAASILGLAPTDLVGPAHLETFTCRFHGKSDPYTTLSFNVYVEASEAEAERKMDEQEDGFTFLSSIDTLPGLGDMAWRAPDSRVRRLMVRKGATWVDIVTPGDSAAQVRIAHIVLGHL